MILFHTNKQSFVHFKWLRFRIFISRNQSDLHNCLRTFFFYYYLSNRKNIKIRSLNSVIQSGLRVAVEIMLYFWINFLTNQNRTTTKLNWSILSLNLLEFGVVCCWYNTKSHSTIELVFGFGKVFLSLTGWRKIWKLGSLLEAIFLIYLDV